MKITITESCKIKMFAELLIGDVFYDLSNDDTYIKIENATPFENGRAFCLNDLRTHEISQDEEFGIYSDFEFVARK